MSSLPVSLRLKMADDVAPIFSDWLRSYRTAGPGVSAIPSETYFWNAHGIVESLLADKTCAVLVASDPGDPRKVYGWCAGQRASSDAGEMTILHYVYVRKLYRRLGLGTQLVNALDSRPRNPEEARILVVTHTTPAGRELLAPLYGDAVLYNPYLAWVRAPAPGSQKTKLKRRDPVAVSRRVVAHAGHVRGDVGGAAPEENDE